jgi:glycosyltransferase involved in cell wall biosynthesis
MTTSPLVSIILPVFNGSKFLERTILSILAQKYRNFHLIICDDASSDDSVKIIENFLNADPRISLLRNSKNQGIGFTFRRLLLETKGEYIAQIGHDDLWMPDFLSSAVQTLSLDTNASVVFSNVQIIDASGSPLTTPSLFRHSMLLKPRISIIGQLLRGNFLCAASSLIRRSCAVDLYEHLPELVHLQDHWLWQQLILKGSFGFIDSPLVHYRIHGNNFSLHNAQRKTEQLELSQCQTDMLYSPYWTQMLAELSDEQISSLFSPLLDSPLSPFEIAPLLPPLLTSIQQRPDLPELVSIYNFLRWSCGANSAKITLSVEKIYRTHIDSSDLLRWSWLILIGRLDSPPAMPFLKSINLGPLQVLRFKAKKGLLPRFYVVRKPSKSFYSLIEDIVMAKQRGPLRMLKYFLKNLIFTGL